METKRVEESVGKKTSSERMKKFLGFIEKTGNKLPDPFLLFVIFAVIVLVLSFILNKAGVSVTYMAAAKGGGAPKLTTVAVKNLLDAGFFQEFLRDFIKTYITFPPLGIVMVLMLGIGYVQDTGFFDAFMKKTLMGAPPFMITFMLAFVGICANISGNAGIIISTTLGAALFASLGRNAILGAIVGYVAGHGGFTANLLVTGDDALLSGITASAAKSMGIVAPIHPLMNYFFMVPTTFVIATVITVVTEYVMPMYVDPKGKVDTSGIEARRVTPAEIKGLKMSFWYFVAFLVLILIGAVPQHGILRNAAGGFLPNSPLVDGVVAILFFLFVVVGTGYGIGSGSIKNHRDVPKYMAGGLKSSLSYFVVAFPAAFFIYFFSASKLAVILSVNGAEFLKTMNFTGVPLAIAFVILVAFLNLFLTSGSSKWLILAPIFVPMFAQVGFSPALTQVAFRIGDTCTNPVTPINYFIPIVLAIMEQYKKEGEEIGLGNVISMTLPYGISFLIMLIILLVVFMVFNIPLGPGVGLWM
jgi:aminobenzoyl-glutamate transport protein